MTGSRALGLATSATGPEPSVACLAMLAGLTRWGWRVQHFRTRACLTAKEAVGQVTGMPGRHLDAWLMPAGGLPRAVRPVGGVGRALGGRGDAGRSLIAGSSGRSCEHPGDLRPIAEALDLPILAVVSCREGDSDSFHLPMIPEGADAILLDEVPDPAALPRLRRLIELATGLPVIGAIEAMPELRAAMEQHPPDRRLPEDLIEALARGFLPHADLPALDELARRRPFPDGGCAVRHGSAGGRRRFRVAYAQDEAFGGYFPDTIEAARGAGCRPRRVLAAARRGPARRRRPGDDRLRAPDHHADVLASNHSMIAALGEHVCLRASDLLRGGRDRLPGPRA